MDRAIARLQRRRRIWEAKQTPPRPSKPSGAAKVRSRLLSLPRELRDQIFEYVLVTGLLQVRTVDVDNSDTRVRRRTTLPTHGRRDGGWIVQTASYRIECSGGCELPTVSLLQTCRQMNREGGRMFYSKNTFYVDVDDVIIPTALAFFDDWSSVAMKSIKSIKILICGDEDTKRCGGYCSFHYAATWNEVMRFKIILQEQLLALDHISIIYRSFPLDMRTDKISGEWLLARTFLDAGWTSGLEQIVTGMGILLLLHDFKRVSITVRASDVDPPQREDADRHIAFVALLRSRLLKGGEKLGHVNISLHHRHSMEEIRPRTGDAVFYKRNKFRLAVVCCDDDENGRSLLQPPTRISPRWIDINHWVATFGSEQRTVNYPYGWGDGYFSEEKPDYDASDDGENYSLKDIALNDDDLRLVGLEHFTKGPWSKTHPKDTHWGFMAKDHVKTGIALRRLWECRCDRHEKCDGGEHCFHKACRSGK